MQLSDMGIAMSGTHLDLGDTVDSVYTYYKIKFYCMCGCFIVIFEPEYALSLR